MYKTLPYLCRGREAVFDRSRLKRTSFFLNKNKVCLKIDEREVLTKKNSQDNQSRSTMIANHGRMFECSLFRLNCGLGTL